ncbi:hypothetical protein [Hyphococcus sp.]|uniref:hypothetical protein n=1 Tax=Hyphococcus sp. TaxID=2038636 RepID=UPI003CCBA1B4
MKIAYCVVTALLLAACSATEPDTDAAGPAEAFMARIAAHCGEAFEGRMVSDDDADTDFARERLVMHVRKCTDNQIRIPFHVGDDRSRTWVISRTEEGLRLKHDHRHEDGSEDAVTQYGGDSAIVTEQRVEFPVDDYSVALFKREGLTASVTNVWAMEITETVFAYELSRENRFFRVEFDLTAPVPAPPAPWGADEGL